MRLLASFLLVPVAVVAVPVMGASPSRASMVIGSVNAGGPSPADTVPSRADPGPLASVPSQGPAPSGRRASSATVSTPALPGRESDARVAAVAFRLAVAGLAHCPAPGAATGLVLDHLSQFAVADRPGMIAALALDRGPAATAVVTGSPAALAGIRPGDVLLAIGGAPLPAEPGLSAPFDPARARARADLVDDQLAGGGSRALTLWRDGATIATRLDPVPACPSRVRLARSEQRNAYADETHVLVTTGLMRRLANDDELAFVLAHEMAHNILGHAAVMRGPEVTKGLGRTLGKSGTIVRAAERDADALAGALMLAAGFDPVRGAEALRRTGGLDLGIGLFAAHAPTAERIAAMRALVAARATPR